MAMVEKDRSLIGQSARDWNKTFVKTGYCIAFDGNYLLPSNKTVTKNSQIAMVNP